MPLGLTQLAAGFGTLSCSLRTSPYLQTTCGLRTSCLKPPASLPKIAKRRRCDKNGFYFRKHTSWSPTLLRDFLFLSLFLFFFSFPRVPSQAFEQPAHPGQRKSKALLSYALLSNSNWSPIRYFLLNSNASRSLQTACELRTSVSKLLRDRLNSRERADAENTASTSYADAPDWVRELMDSVSSDEEVYSDDLGGEPPALSSTIAFCDYVFFALLSLFLLETASPKCGGSVRFGQVGVLRRSGR